MNFEKILKKAESDIEQYGWTFMFVDADQVSVRFQLRRQGTA